jgi:hypothetical protein
MTRQIRAALAVELVPLEPVRLKRVDIIPAINLAAYKRPTQGIDYSPKVLYHSDAPSSPELSLTFKKIK